MLDLTMLDQVSPSAVLWTGGAAAAAFGLHVYRTHSRNVQAFNNTPGLRTIISILRPTMRILPAGKIPYTDWFFSIGPNRLASKGHEGQSSNCCKCIDLYAPDFRIYGQDIITGVSLHKLHVPLFIQHPLLVVPRLICSMHPRGRCRSRSG